MNKQIINDQTQTIHRLQQEIVKLEKRVETSGETIDEVIEALYPNADEDELFAIAFNGEWIDDLKERLEKLSTKEQECEELKKEIAFGNNGTLSDKIRAEVFKELNNENQKLKQTLTEIKEIAENSCGVCTKKDFETYEDCQESGKEDNVYSLKQILQIISEVEE